MKKNLLYTLYAVCFIVICAVPAVAMLFNKGGKLSYKDFPKIRYESGSPNWKYANELGDWFSENYAFRADFINMNNTLVAKVFNTSANNDVILGKDGWLFYSETLDDYTKTNLLSERGLNNIARNIGLMAEYCEANGAKFIFAPAPNKNSIYGRYMPDRYISVQRADGNYTNLKKRFGSDGVFCDLGQLYELSYESIPLYHKTDSHWNNYGANKGKEIMLEKLGKPFKPLQYTGSSYTRRGDLYDMLFPEGAELDLQFDYNYPINYSLTEKYQGLIVNSSCEDAEGTLLMFRDSFGEAVIPLLAREFASAEYSRVIPYRMDSIGTGNADYVILEIVERNLPDLQLSAPVMQAPVREVSFIPDSETKNTDIYCEVNNNYLHIYGVLDESFFKTNNDAVYVQVNGVFYEAFRAYESNLLSGITGSDASDFGYSLYVPYTESADISVITAAGNYAISSQTVRWTENTGKDVTHEG